MKDAGKEPGESKKVYVGLSGGVDSAVSAALLQEQGYDVTGVFIRIALEGYPCTAEEDRISALRVATHLDIPFLEIDLSREYKTAVFEPALREFARGRTPNPDTLCNREIKFGLFYAYARAQGADFVATGHYAQVRKEVGPASKVFSMIVSKDAQKDQTYFLWALPATHLPHVMFPVGGLEKREVRALAQKFSLPNAARKDSQGLCFLGPISITDMLMAELPHEPGDVLDVEGHVIGKHEGVVLYTVGQRHGFTLNTHSPETHPHFVVSKNIELNTITVSALPQRSLGKDGLAQRDDKCDLIIVECNWFSTPQAGDTCKARFRYRQALIDATVVEIDHKAHTARVELSTTSPVPLGQSLVLYREHQHEGEAEQESQQECVGGGIIDSIC